MKQIEIKFRSKWSIDNKLNIMLGSKEIQEQMRTTVNV